MLRLSLLLSTLLLLGACGQAPVQENTPSIETLPEPEKYSVIFGGTEVGDLTVTFSEQRMAIDFGFENNGRGASSQESLTLDANMLPVEWTITGKTTFGNAIDESFVLENGQAQWRAAAGEGQATVKTPSVYVAQNASPYSLYLIAQAILNNGGEALPALPGGTVALSALQPLQLQHSAGMTDAQVYALKGIQLDPSYLVLGEDNQFIATMSARFALVRDGFQGEEQRLRDVAATLNANRFEDIAAKVSHEYAKPVKIINARIFDPQSLSLTSAKTVTVDGERIVAIDDYDNAFENTDTVVIDAQGGTLVAGLYEMHGHMRDNDALLNVLAGVTSVRDMGNEIDVLDDLVEKINSGKLIGPRIIRSGFIEGKSPFSAATGELASTEEEALALVRRYAQLVGYSQIKIYSSVNGDWVPAMAAEAHKLGLRVAGHVPAFFTADQMIEAGYDELTHINQVMLGWVLTAEEDTRTLFRITGMRRFANLDLDSEPVQKTLNLMVENNIAVDPTTVIHELGLTARNGETRAGVVDYIEHMPVGVQREAKLALLNVADASEDADYKAAFDKIIAMLSMMHERGILLVPGTDLGGAFELHRELELFQQFGMTPAEVLKRASYDMAQYLGFGDDLGSVDVGKMADFFLVPGDPTTDLKAIKTISLVTKDGTFFFPTQVYPEFGITPFTAVPPIQE